MPSEKHVDKKGIVEGLGALGLPRGAVLIVHSSLSSQGTVDGGVDTVIDALLEALGPDGTLMMPTHPARDGRTFDPDTIPSDMGVISETFRLRPGVIRSRHPYHPVAACGRRAEEMLRDHEMSSVPDGPETPYGRLIEQGGWALHIGCDLDTLTLVHSVEAELDLAYLRELEMEYVDAQGQVQTLGITRCPGGNGGHRGGVLKFDRLFREEGAMTVGRIGQAVCRLIFAPKAVPIMRREMSRDPGFALDENPNCADCVRYRGQIKAARLAEEDFKLTAPLWAVEGDMERALAAIQGEGISLVELHANRLDFCRSALDELAESLEKYGCTVPILRAQMRSPESMGEVCAAAARMGARYLHVPAVQQSAQRSRWIEELGELATQAAGEGLAVLLSNRRGSLAESAEELSAAVRDVGHPSVFAGYDPTEIALAGGSSFYTTGLYKGPLRRCTHHVDLRDVVIEGSRPAVPGRGNAQIKEIISNLRCRSYNGTFCLWPMPGEGVGGFRTAARGFWAIMDSI